MQVGIVFLDRLLACVVTAEDRAETPVVHQSRPTVGQRVRPLEPQHIGEPRMMANEEVRELREIDGRNVDVLVRLEPAVTIKGNRHQTDVHGFQAWEPQAERVHFRGDLPVGPGERVERDEVPANPATCFSGVRHGNGGMEERGSLTWPQNPGNLWVTTCAPCCRYVEIGRTA